MKIRNLATAVAASTILLATTALPAHALPSTLFDDGVTVGGVHFDVYADNFETGHIYGWVNDATAGSTTSHRNAALTFFDSNLSQTEDLGCDSATADETVDGNDTVLTCDENALTGIYTDLSVKPEMRIFPADDNGVATIRVMYKVTNISNSSVTVDEARSLVDFDEYYGDQVWSGDSSLFGAADFVEETGVSWYALGAHDSGDDSVLVNMSTFGSAWQSDDADVTFTIDGDLANDEEFNLVAQDVTFAPGETRYFVFFTVGAFIPADATNDEASAIIDDTFAAMAKFDEGLVGELAAGIPAGADVANWVTTNELADTGTDVFGSVGFAGALLAAGIAAVVIRRRARA